MAKISKWENMADYVKTALQFIDAVPNPTAEQVGMKEAYTRVLAAMSNCERLEKKLDKA